MEQVELGPPPYSNSSETMLLSEVKGSVKPRLSTPPLRELTPETSYGYQVIEFADKVLGEPLLEWQEQLVIRIGELLPDGKPRFKKVLILIARQNGKTHLIKVLSLYWMFIERVELVAGIGSTLKQAKEAWNKAIGSARSNPHLRPLIDAVRRDNNDPHLSTVDNSRYMPAAATEDSLRGFTVDRLIIDELRSHKDYKAWDGAVYTVRTKPYSQIICLSNAGSDDSLVLNDLRDSALEYIKSEGLIGDPSLGLFEWSADEGADPADPKNWALANPSMGVRNPVTRELVLNPTDIQADAIRAVSTGGPALAGFMTEVLCMHVRALDTAVDARAWTKGYRPGELIDTLSPFTWGLDFDYNETEASLVAAQLTDEGTLIQVIKTWRKDELHLVAAELEEKLKQYRPRQFAWFPGGPAARLASSLKTLKIPGVNIRALTGAEVFDATMGFADAVNNGQVQYGLQDAVLNDHVTGAQKAYSGDRWRFTRKTRGSVDAAYAAAGAWYLANTMPPPLSVKLIGPD